MKIREWQRPASRMSIEKFMSIDVPESRVNQHGLMIDAVKILVVERQDIEVYVAVGKSDGKYYSNIGYAALEWGSSCDAWKSRKRSYGGKIKAFEGAIRKCMSERRVIDHPGLIKDLEAALRNLDKYKYKQLTLF